MKLKNTILAALLLLVHAGGSACGEWDVTCSTAPNPAGSSPTADPLAPLSDELTAFLDTQTIEWSLNSGESLRSALDRWSKDAGWTLVWQAGVDYPISADVAYPLGTTFKEAVKETMRSFWQRDRSIAARPYLKNSVLVIVDA